MAKGEFRQCTAISKQSQERCKRRASPGFAVCVIHGSRGGRKPSTFRYARVTDKDPDLKRNWEEIVDDPTADDFDLTPEIMLMRARLATAIEKGTVDIKVVQQIHNDLVKAVQRNTEIQIKRQALIQRTDAEKILRAAIRAIVPFIPELMRPQAFEELTRVLAAMGTGDGPVMRSEAVLALPAHEEEE